MPVDRPGPALMELIEMTTEDKLFEAIDAERLPAHVAIIMDGNGRWAKERGLPRSAGHRQGVETLREVVRYASSLGIGVLTMFAFSTENWRRPPWEVKYLMGLPQEYLYSELPELIKNNVRVNLLGDPRRLPGRPGRPLKKDRRDGPLQRYASEFCLITVHARR